MQQHVIVCQIRAFALLAEMEQMKAENTTRAMNGQALAYDESAFGRLALRLEELARDAGQVY